MTKELIEAIQSNDPRRIDQLLQQGADPNGVEDWACVTPLHHAVTYCDPTTVFTLLKAGANQVENCSGETPLDLASQFGDSTMAQLLRDFGHKTQNLI